MPDIKNKEEGQATMMELWTDTEMKWPPRILQNRQKGKQRDHLREYKILLRDNKKGTKKLVEKLLLQHRERPGNSKTLEADFETTFQTK